MKTIRLKIDNRKNTNVLAQSSIAFADKNVLGIKLFFIPISLWTEIGKLASIMSMLCICGGFLYYDPGWRGSPEMVYFIATGLFVSVALIAISTVFRLDTKLLRMRANVIDYIEMRGPGRQREVFEGKEVNEINTAEKAGRRSVPRNTLVGVEGPKLDTESKIEIPPKLDETAASSDELMNIFLKEFFA